MWPFSATNPVVSLEQAGSLQVKQQESPVKTYDYIIVGGGTAGCCLAARLSEDSSVSVLLLERGGVHDPWFSRIPLISSDVTSKATPIVRSPSAPIKAAESQVVDVVHAETLGGGSAVNAMLVTRGTVGDFNHWAELGHPSWDYNSLKPYFIKPEKSLSQTSDDRGYSVCPGPLVNQTFPDLPFNIQRKVRDAAITLGFADVKDLNSPTVPVDACATLDVAVDESLRRVSSYHAFLPAQVVQDHRERLKISTDAVATRIDFDKNVAVGVVFEPTNETRAQTFYARAKKEIIVCCGALGSPHLLLLSGIGRKEDLEEHGIESVVDLLGVGAHLQDHVGLPLMYEVPLEDTLHHIENSTWKGIIEFGKYLLSRKGIVGNTVSPMSIFAHSTHFDDHTAAVISPIPSAAIGGDRPDLEIMPVPHWCSDLPYENQKGFFSFLLCIVQPRSVGSVRLASRDSHARPSVDLGFLSNPEDFVTFRRGVTLCLRLAEEVHQGYHMKDFQVPLSEKGSDMDQFIRATIRTCYHYASSLAGWHVYGVRGLRVYDASVFPCITSGHTMAPVIVVAERCANLIKKIAVDNISVVREHIRRLL
ncbi:alcohol oxidase [Mycena albidolilacea]|uniref:Alcohol oxidase n=1 Tax=Mycena albidolilacea TaxID=1033008 RepID=A0AAD7AUW7_9AGAR|nr:alcohol oxidase [Mycena albidolilacea]